MFQAEFWCASAASSATASILVRETQVRRLCRDPRSNRLAKKLDKKSDRKPSKRIVLVGSESLLGRELRELLTANSLGSDLRLVAGSEEQAGSFTEQGGEAAVLAPLAQIAVEDADVVLLSGGKDSAEKFLDLRSHAAIIDLAGSLEDEPNARLRAPLVETAGFSVPSGTIHVMAHPAAVAIALLLTRLHSKFPLTRAIIQIFEPASERGSLGVEEMQTQAVNLFAFKPLPKKVFDAQAAFNLLAGLGEEAGWSLEEVERRIDRHVASLLAGNPERLNRSQNSLAPLPSIRLIQAPVFHGYSLSFWVEFTVRPAEKDLRAALEGDSMDVYGADLEPPNNVAVAEESGLSVGAICEDRNDSRAMWIWCAFDNLRLAAESAVRVAEELV